MILQGTTPTLTITVNPDELLLSDVVEIELTVWSTINGYGYVTWAAIEGSPYEL